MIILRKYAENNSYICRMKNTGNRAVYIYQQSDWPNFKWNNQRVAEALDSVQERQARLLGMLSVLGFDLQNNTALESMTEDVLRSSEIECELLNRDSVRSSIARHLGIDIQSSGHSDHYTEGIVQVAIDTVKNCHQPLDKDRLCNWHAALFPTGRSGMYRITVADWRQGNEPMLVVSGAMWKERVHYEAPPSAIISRAMELFLKWFNGTEPVNPLLKSAIAHLWFVSIHPFSDGNGRLARTITDMLLAKSDATPYRFYSMSTQIALARKEYYDILEQTQKGTLDITEWLLWFLGRLDVAIKVAMEIIERTLNKATFWESHRNVAMNERQTKMVNMR